MKRKVEEKLAASLTAETTELLPFLPYLLQDFWEMGSDPDVMIQIISEYIKLPKYSKVLDLGCGKGAVSVKLAYEKQVIVKGIDLISDFIDIANKKAEEYNIEKLCEFVVGDINESVKIENDYNVVILGAVGDVLGTPKETLQKLKLTIKSGRYILIDECYICDNSKKDDIQYINYEYLTRKQWEVLFEKTSLELIAAVVNSDVESLDNSVSDMAKITLRANELIEKYPDKRDIFYGYIRSQQNEYDDINNSLVPVVWVLKKM